MNRSLVTRPSPRRGWNRYVVTVNLQDRLSSSIYSIRQLTYRSHRHKLLEIVSRLVITYNVQAARSEQEARATAKKSVLRIETAHAHVVLISGRSSAGNARAPNRNTWNSSPRPCNCAMTPSPTRHASALTQYKMTDLCTKIETKRCLFRRCCI